MGNSEGKPESPGLLKWLEQQPCKDWKIVCGEDRELMTNYKLWVTRFGYTGRLRVGDLVELRGRLKESCKGKQKKEKKVGLAHLDGWMKIAQKRHEGEAKATEERREKAAEERKRKEEAELEKRLEAMMLRRQEDDESRPPNRRRPVEDEAGDPESGKEDTALEEERPKDRPRTSQNPFRPLQPLYPIRELNQASAPPASPPPVSPPPYQHTQSRRLETKDQWGSGQKRWEVYLVQLRETGSTHIQ